MLKNYLKRVFEHKSLKPALGANLALMVVLSSFVPGNISPIDTADLIIREENTPLTTQKTVQYPLENYVATQGFSLFHPGVDLAAPIGTDVYPIKDGVVEAVSYSKYAYGNAVLIKHDGEVTSLYAHLSKISVTPGDKTTTLNKLGKSGSSGRSTGPHLHLEIRSRGTPINPFVILREF